MTRFNKFVGILILSNLVAALSYSQTAYQAAKIYVSDLETEFKINSLKDRPKACPLRSTDHQDILDALTKIFTTLNKDNCKDDAAGKQELAKLESAIKEISASKSAYDKMINPNFADEDRFKQEQLIVNNVNGSLRILSELSVIKECAENSEKRNKLVPAIAAIVRQTAGFTAFIPGPESLLAATSMVGLANFVEIIDLLMRQADHTAMDTADQRKAFLDITCAIFDVRSDIEKSQILSLKTENHKKETLAKKKQVDKMNSLLESLGRESDKVNKFEFIKKLDEWKSFGTEVNKTKTSFKEKGPVLKQVFALQSYFLKELPKINMGEFGNFIKGPAIDWMTKLFATTNDENSIMKHYLNVLNQSQYSTLIDKITNPGAEWKEIDNYFLTEKDTISSDYQDIGEKINTKLEYDTLLADISRWKSNFEMRIKILEENITDKGPSPVKGGSFNLSEIARANKRAKEIVYGKRGKNLIKFLRISIRDNINLFVKDYERIFPLIEPVVEYLKKLGELKFAHFERVTSDQAKKAKEFRTKIDPICPKLINLRNIWSETWFDTQFGREFFITNKNIFHDNFSSRLRKYFGDERHKRYVFNEYYHYQQSWKRIENGKIPDWIDWKIRKGVGKLRWSFGHMMEKVYFNLGNAQSLQKVIDFAGCQE